jgi:hypothetical protein
MYKTKAGKEQFRRLIILHCENTVGYAESENKVEYMKGVQAAITAALEKFEESEKIFEARINIQDNMIKKMEKVLDPLVDFIKSRLDG